MNVDTALGNSADKPIELDVDLDIAMADLFGDGVDNSSTDDTTGLFSPATAPHELPMQDEKLVKQESSEMGILDALSAVGDAEGHEDLFASFSRSDSQPSTQNQPQANTTPDGSSVLVDSSSSRLASAPSPGSILASFTASQMNVTDQPSSSDAHSLAVGDTHFDLDSLGLLNGEEIEELLKTEGFGSSA
jgi:hypothetical protein